VQARAGRVLADRLAGEIDHAGADRPPGRVLRVRDRDDDVVLVGHRDAVMRRHDACRAQVERPVQHRLLAEDADRVLAVEPLRDVALELDEMGRPGALEMDGQECGVLDVDVAVVAMVVEGDAAADRADFTRGPLHREDRLAAGRPVERGRSLDGERVEQAAVERVDHLDDGLGMVGHEQPPGSHVGLVGERRAAAERGGHGQRGRRRNQSFHHLLQLHGNKGLFGFRVGLPPPAQSPARAVARVRTLWRIIPT
jgi:hypothetical protein